MHVQATKLLHLTPHARDSVRGTKHMWQFDCTHVSVVTSTQAFLLTIQTSTD